MESSSRRGCVRRRGTQVHGAWPVSRPRVGCGVVRQPFGRSPAMPRTGVGWKVLEGARWAPGSAGRSPAVGQLGHVGELFVWVGGGPRQAPSVDPYQALQSQVVTWDDVVLPALGDMDDLCRGGIDLLGRVLEGSREGCTRGPFSASRSGGPGTHDRGRSSFRRGHDGFPRAAQ